MIIEVERSDIDNSRLLCDYYVDGRYYAESFVIEEVEQWAEENSQLDWSYIKKRNSGEHELIEGKYEDFYSWARENFGEHEAKSFLEWKLKS